MLDPSDLFQPSDHVEPALRSEAATDRVLLVTLGSHGDAGESQALVDDHLLEQFANHRLGRFDADQLIDYAGHRPGVIFDRDHFRGYEPPEISLHELTDGAGHDFLLLCGPEPALQWERFAASIDQVVGMFGVGRVVILQAFPAPAPHTRPVQVSTFASDAALLEGRTGLPATFKLGAGFSALLTLRLGEQGRQVIGLVAHVPHYLADTQYPAAAIALLSNAEQVSGLRLPTEGRLAQAAAVTQRIVDQQVADSPEAQQVVTQLEEQYEHATRQRQLTSGAGLPTADEIGAEVEAFLQGLGPSHKPDRPQSGTTDPAGPQPHPGQH